MVVPVLSACIYAILPVMPIHREASQRGQSPLLLLITAGPEMNESPWGVDTKGQGH